MNAWTERKCTFSVGREVNSIYKSSFLRHVQSKLIQPTCSTSSSVFASTPGVDSVGVNLVDVRTASWVVDLTVLGAMVRDVVVAAGVVVVPDLWVVSDGLTGAF